ncbi:MAG: hemolysin [Candidatus Infernicultor aquiphilus]|uniref:Hemolysin n=1 Tax=Candidatus Infernicultor aquiphilus TaxID=1805029 RepID=A0A1J5GJI4_9BACT|nr:HlyC/CorC family transporter [bacterium]OIP69746.1 MAG: hemolysin [Candidatus Atribacteria bacterium CG2_30_33_13]PIU25387.1 MAG: hemolysin [Candidatus Atribacteria bacterium CG08_land_8_20_14_0_20_33_29]PIW12040.1 MAG: hemolysin [Candidatus Atribacteria bacterium CG17_big_fil_post_rev_8_21_14_2_50_34_11]PIX34725.1 MAG: hemolysin [Candidatus Atribacteria bacterium CG_4_8_14_3_um_filter_34_18]PIY33169.1 MAG: hemolysin [Candidatus Atribacteria bacterium CG_4_10_14_3_um_filter_34_13]PJB56976.
MDNPDNFIILIIEAVCLLGFLILSAFFSGSETALFSLNKLQLKKMQKEESGWRVNSIIKLLDDPQKTLITILTGNTFVNIAASSLATYLAIKLFGNVGIGIAGGIMIFMILVFGEIVPKSLAISNAETIAKKIARPVEIISSFLFPLILFFKIIINALYYFYDKKRVKEKKEITEEDLITLINVGKDEGVIEEEEKKMIRNIFEFGDTMVKEVMVPRVDMACISSNAKLDSILNLIKKIGHSRTPVYKETIDNIIGILYTKDLLAVYEQWYKSKEKFDLKKIIRRAYFVPENKKIDDLLDIFQRDKIQIAIAIDEYGGTAGLVTMEDVVEEIVGEIIDEYDKETKLYEIIDNNTVIADGIISIDKINELLNIEIPENDFETLGGFIYDLIGRVPNKNETIAYKNIQITIEQVVKNRIIRVIIKKFPGLQRNNKG